MIHRDIKPANVLLKCEKGVILKAVLTDFGFTCAAGSDHESPGSWMYMSPELLKCAPNGQPGDVWACGVTLMELWTGLLEDTPDEEWKERVAAEYQPPAQLGPCWQDRCEHLLQRSKYVHRHLKQCFLPMRERIKMADLCAAMTVDKMGKE